MKRNLDTILLTILWLLAITLGTCFWFNTVYGFNVFSIQHWHYLSVQQAQNAHIKPSFYISFGVAIFILITGMYILARPHTHKIKSSTETKKATPPVPQSAPIVPESQTAPQDTLAKDPASTPIFARPPRLKLPTATKSIDLKLHPTAQANIASSASTNQVSQDNSEIRDIFTNAGYVIKTSPRIGNTTPALVAIGTNEVVWLGAIGITKDTMRTMVDKLNNIFTDTLDSIDIDIRPFIVNATGSASLQQDDNILLFDSVDNLREYISTNQNIPPSDDEAENFNAYSEYIDTVLGYIGKL